MTDLDTLTDAWNRLTPGPAPVDQILRAHHARRQVRRRRVLAGAGAAAAVIVVAASLAVQAQRTTPTPEPGTPPASAPARTPGPTGPPSAVPSEVRSRIYFLVGGSGLPYLGITSVERRTVGGSADGAVERLLGGRPPRRSDPSGSGFGVLDNAWLDDEGRPGATLRSIDRGDGLVIVDLATAADWLASGLPPDLPGRQLPLLQVVCTAQAALGTTDPVRITLRGDPVRLFGLDASRPRSCAGPLLDGVEEGD